MLSLLTASSFIWIAVIAVCGFFLFHKKRKYISFGIMWAILLPLILVGGCFTVFMVSYGR
jgi:hypothetical protein